MSINFQELLKVCEATEKLPLGGFDMGILNCGTAGCMIGNYNEFVGRDRHFFGSDFDGREEKNDWHHFGISEEEYSWLFDGGPGTCDVITQWSNIGDGWLHEVERTSALRRLRKFIYYKLHKHEMTYDEKYGVKESARRAEGNQNFAQRAKAEALAAV